MVERGQRLMIRLTAEELAMATPTEVAAYYKYILNEAKNSGDWQEWLAAFAGSYTKHSFADHHKDFWNWVYSIQPNVSGQKSFIGVWARGGAKSTSAELAVVNLGARGVKRYCLYVSETQEQADAHVSNIATLLESKALSEAYSGLGDRLMGKYGNAKGWRRNRLRTASGFIVDALGLDTASRGIKLDEQRPDLLVIDDLDGELDTVATTDKKEKILTTAIIPAGSEDLTVLGIQNLIHANGIFAKLVDGRADYLKNRMVSGPIPAIKNMAYDQKNGKTVITGGIPTWEGQDIEQCQARIEAMGITAFLSECQHDTEPPAGGMFSHLSYQHCNPEDVPDLVRTVVWIDPAVTDTDRSDAMGIQVDGISSSGVIYRLRSFESRSTPLEVVKQGLAWAIEYGASELGIETDQGGDVWKSVYREACREIGVDINSAPKYRSEKAGSIGPKAHRASLMLADYERPGRIIHVIGSHQILERALRRFPIMKPYDLVDAAFWSWRSLRPGKRKRMVQR
jgi:hypothetical protein